VSALPVSENFRPFAWTKAKAEAAILLAEDALPDVEIAKRAEVSDRQLRTWKQHPDFRSRVEQHVAELEAAMLRYEIAKRRRRVAALDDRWHRMLRVIEARAEAMADDAPGTDTGLLVKQIKVVGTGKTQQTIEEYAVDTGLLKELRAHEEQAAKELGQSVTRQELTGFGGGPIEVEHRGGLTDRERAERLAAFFDLVRARVSGDAGGGQPVAALAGAADAGLPERGG
jgi:hypothetical protein